MVFLDVTDFWGLRGFCRFSTCSNRCRCWSRSWRRCWVRCWHRKGCLR
eukprot:Nitzschia sp. Nitz4//scaffold422_size12231//4172//4315//NITZ4_008996-RA/size12231-exonerate_est2genome-gene-0.7-mRNA-1//1//CDS//3329551575//1746//frame0